MAEFSLSWRPEDYLDIQWLSLPRFALSALRGFTGLAKGEAIEQAVRPASPRDELRGDPDPDHHHRLQHGPRHGRVLRHRADSGGPGRPPGPGGDRAAPVHRVGPGPRPPLRRRRGDRGLAGAAGDRGRRTSITSSASTSCSRPASAPRTSPAGRSALGGLFEASRQLQQGYHLELARRARDELGDKLTLIDPVDASELRGTSFYDLFLDRGHWPRLIRQGYDAATEALESLRRTAASQRT